MHVSDKEFNAQFQNSVINTLNRYLFFAHRSEPRLLEDPHPDRILSPSGRHGAGL